jgi:hypothetical protein
MFVLLSRRKIRLIVIEGNAKCRYLKKVTCRRDFAAGVYLAEAQNPIPPPFHTVAHTAYVYALYLFTQGRGEGGRVGPERRLEGQQLTKLYRSFLEMTTFCFGVYIIN